jgi:hypothetical protein
MNGRLLLFSIIKRQARLSLEMVKVGGRSCTSEEALQRFFDRLTGDQKVVTPPTITQRQRLREIERAEERLRGYGI